MIAGLSVAVLAELIIGLVVSGAIAGIWTGASRMGHCINGSTVSVTAISMPTGATYRTTAIASAVGLVVAVPTICVLVWAGWSVQGRSPGLINLPTSMVLFSIFLLTTPCGAKCAPILQRHLAFADLWPKGAVRNLRNAPA